MGNLFVISGPSGSGKSTICKEVVKQDEKIVLSVSATTRSPRKGEKNGREYFFISMDEFRKKIEHDEFYEYANVYDHFYGTLKSFVDEKLEAGYDVILEIDPQGAFQAKNQRDDATLIFILPPSLDELAARLKGRGSETEQQLNLRFSKAKSEMELVGYYHYSVVNDTLEAASRKVLEIIKSKRDR